MPEASSSKLPRMRLLGNLASRRTYTITVKALGFKGTSSTAIVLHVPSTEVQNFADPRFEVPGGLQQFYPVACFIKLGVMIATTFFAVGLP